MLQCRVMAPILGLIWSRQDRGLRKGFQRTGGLEPQSQQVNFNPPPKPQKTLHPLRPSSYSAGLARHVLVSRVSGLGLRFGTNWPWLEAQAVAFFCLVISIVLSARDPWLYTYIYIYLHTYMYIYICIHMYMERFVYTCSRMWKHFI